MTLSDRITAEIAGFRRENTAHPTVMVELLEECLVVIKQADENFKSISDTCSMIDAEIERLQNLPITRVQG